MNATAAPPVVGVDLANSMFQVAVADGSWQVVESHQGDPDRLRGIRFKDP